jgi:APA family basic amino acid/polyamine antiporter
MTTLTTAKIAGIVAIVVGVFFFSRGGTWKNLGAAPDVAQWNGMKPFSAAMLAALWAYNGWNTFPWPRAKCGSGRNIRAH